LLGTSTHTLEYFCGKSSGRYLYGIRWNQWLFIAIPPQGRIGKGFVFMGLLSARGNPDK
jgi:hypothetical protein